MPKSIHHGAIVVAAGMLALSLSACGSSSKKTTRAKSSSAATVVIKNFEFKTSGAARVGSEVTVRNDDDTTHTVSADDKTFDTGNVKSGGSSTFKVTKPGRVSFHCDIHDYMKGVIQVAA